MEKERFIRLRSGILYTLNKLAEEGHCFALRQQLIDKAAELLEADEAKLEITLDEMLRTEDVIRDEEAIYLPPFYYSETGCARELLRLLGAERKVKIEVQSILHKVTEHTAVTYDEIQQKAIETAACSKVMVMTGGPGTGKTTTAMGIISACHLAGCRIILAAPTGRAAKRLSESAGMEPKPTYSEHRSMYSYVRLSIIDVQLRTSEHRIDVQLRTLSIVVYSYYV